ncbi:tRNA threonylcarbamoyladenosine biosynthesis protein RimN [Luteimonas yindakuii]|uniref:L-threonylcarbamoyladenylate synthase n=1 Tax=Luteimonas yindakuii TaxID=2565782 RepID=UPI0010A47EC5|nr:Sua5/YciO/YrdC/YwlC family protein [Luteimonas yindakuii]QCO66832.1 tRNA threonylcarbamoyladenosine biosynthesis protein RimN [Luteimonas yindakuii]
MTAQPAALSIDAAAARLRAGAVIAYPTEAVWGLGCDPFNEAALLRLLALKARPVDKGVILVAADAGQFDGLVDWDALDPTARAAVLASWPGPHTWIVPAAARVPAWVRGDHRDVAVRCSAHPVVAALCRAFGGPLVSTSANPAGAPPPRTLEAFDPVLGAAVDAIVDGATGGLERPTPIRDARSGQVVRD